MARRETLVFDSAPLIALSAAGFLREITRLGVRAVIAEEVRNEVLGGGRGPGASGELLLERMISEGEFSVRRIKDTHVLARVMENPRLSSADAASLCLARESDGRLVADDRDLRAAARALGVPLGGSLYVLSLAVRRGVLSAQGAVKAVERMIESGWYCSPGLLKSFSEYILGGR